MLSPQNNTPRRSVKFAAWLLVLFVLAVLLELSGYFAGAYLSQKGALYRAQSIEGFDDYLGNRDPVLGWGGQRSAVNDGMSVRHSPSFAENEPACVWVFGDSFTWASEVSDEHAWADRLSRLLGCRVGNYGIPGYGSDQAFLRYRSQPNASAPVVILNHLSENILRNVNQYRWLLYPGAHFQLKPRFILDDAGKSIYIPPPLPDRHAFQKIVDAPEAMLAHDYFVPGGASGNARFGFPYSVSVIRALGQYQVRAKIEGVPWYTEFYERDHPSRGLLVTAGIVSDFAALAPRRGQTPVVSILPTGLDAEHYRATGSWVYGPLVDWLQANGIDHIDVGQGLMDRLEGGDYCSLFIDCTHHFTPQGNQWVADVIAEYLVDKGFISRPVDHDNPSADGR